MLTGATPSCIRATAGHETGDMWSLEVLQGAEAVQCIDAWLRHEGSARNCLGYLKQQSSGFRDGLLAAMKCKLVGCCGLREDV